MKTFLNLVKSCWGYASFPLFEISGNKISIMSILMALLVFYLSIQLSKVVERIVGGLLEDKEIDRGVKGSIQKICRYIVLLCGALMTLETVGINLSSLAAISAVLMVGIGFGLQSITQNFISGLIILLERPIKIGDMVEVEGVSGKIIDIRARSTLIHTRDDIAIIVPNSQFISEQVINESFSGEKVRLHLSIGVSYSSDPREVEQRLIEAAESHSQVLHHPKPRVLFNDYGDSSLNFSLLLWVNDNWNRDVILSDLRFSVSKIFKDNNIEIPFPQRDLHIKEMPKFS